MMSPLFKGKNERVERIFNTPLHIRSSSLYDQTPKF